MQKARIDYINTFAPVVRYDSLHILLAVVIQEDLELLQFDIITALLYGDLEEEIFMEVPEDFDTWKSDENSSDVVCKLQKSLYGLKQAPRCWNLKFCEFLRQFKFVRMEADKCVFRPM